MVFIPAEETNTNLIRFDFDCVYNLANLEKIGSSGFWSDVDKVVLMVRYIMEAEAIFDPAEFSSFVSQFFKATAVARLVPRLRKKG
jgi:hypothetical protein